MVKEYVGVVLNYRVGRKTQKARECLIRVWGVDGSEARQMIGWKVAWPQEQPKIFGRIAGLHGRGETLRARFEKGLPGQALGSRVRICR